MNIGTAVKAIRRKLDITQTILAASCQISQATLSQIECGKKRPNENTIKNICNWLQIPEVIIYIIAMEEKDVSANKKIAYQLVYPSMLSLALELLNTDHTASAREKVSQHN